MAAKKSNIHMRLKTETTEHLEAVPVIAAETVVTRHLKVVDDVGNVRADVALDGAGEEGPCLRLFDRNGRALVVLSVEDGAECHGLTSLWLCDQHDENEVMLSAGSLSGPGIVMTHDRGTVVDIRAERQTGLIQSRRCGKGSTVMQLTPGEQPATFVDEAADESEATS